MGPDLPGEVVRATLYLEFADGRTADVQVTRSEWVMFGGERSSVPEGLPWPGIDRDWEPGQRWYGFAFHPRPGARPAFRLTVREPPPGPRPGPPAPGG